MNYRCITVFKKKKQINILKLPIALNETKQILFVKKIIEKNIINYKNILIFTKETIKKSLF